MNNSNYYRFLIHHYNLYEYILKHQSSFHLHFICLTSIHRAFINLIEYFNYVILPALRNIVLIILFTVILFYILISTKTGNHFYQIYLSLTIYLFIHDLNHFDPIITTIH